MGPLSFFSLAFLGFLIAGPFPRGVEASSCPPEWLSYKGHCYGFFQDKLSWADAEIECQYYATNAHLASIRDEAEGVRVASHIEASQQECVSVWIGLRDYEKNGLWRWSDKSQSNYRPWNAGEPNNLKQNEYCVELWCKAEYRKWNDLNCKLERPYICKYKIAPESAAMRQSFQTRNSSSE